MTDTETDAAPALLETSPWDPLEYLESPDDAMGYLEAAFEDGDPHVIAAVLDDVMAFLLKTETLATGMAREQGLVS